VPWGVSKPVEYLEEDLSVVLFQSWSVEEAVVAVQWRRRRRFDSVLAGHGISRCEFCPLVLVTAKIVIVSKILILARCKLRSELAEDRKSGDRDEKCET
jgi:hypothetical protein